MSPSVNRDSLPSSEIVVSTTRNRDAVHREVRAGRLRLLAPKLYTPNLIDDPEKIIWRNRWSICSAFFPGALIADRTALEGKPAGDGSIFLIAGRATDLGLPGLVFRPRSGTGPIDGSDMPFMGSLWMACQARALLENMRPSRARSHVRRTFSQDELEKWLDGILRKGGGDEALNRLRSQAKALAGTLRMESEAVKLDAIIGALLGSRDAELVTDVGAARSRGLGYDPERLERFDELRVDLSQHPFPDRPSRPGQTFLPFFEAYFSNFIEGTEFLVEEAYAIVYEGTTSAERPEDAHDILDTFRVVSDSHEMRKAPRSPSEFIDLLRRRHAVILAGRPSKRPGEFKLKGNRAGESVFVAPELVRGTLLRGFELLNSLEHPMARAILTMFLVTEVHPFADGNGRVARIMMNAELSSRDHERVIIPSVFRTEYIQSLKTLTHNGRSDALIRTMDLVQNYVSQIDFSDYSHAERVLDTTGAFRKPADAFGDGARLILPKSMDRA